MPAECAALTEDAEATGTASSERIEAEENALEPEPDRAVAVSGEGGEQSATGVDASEEARRRRESMKSNAEQVMTIQGKLGSLGPPAVRCFSY